MNYKNLVISRKMHGRSYEFKGKDFQAPWFLINTETRRKYDTYEEYKEEQEAVAKKEKQVKAMAKARSAKQTRKPAEKED